MKNIFVAIPFLTIMSSVAMAQNDALFTPKDLKNIDCKLNIAPLEKEVDLAGQVPQFFFKPIPRTGPNDKRDDVSLILSGGNYSMDMKNGKLGRIPGPYDGVPTPDGEFIVSPAQGGHITFYDRNDIEKKSPNDFTYDDQSSDKETLNGVYHSMGVLDQKKNADGSKSVTYRAITDTITTSGDDEKNNTLQFKEYTFKISPDGTKELTGTNGAPQFLCSNYPNHMMKTPIISKDGKMLSVYNAETGTSVIYDIQKDSNGKSVCKTKKDLGFAASKMEFSPDGKRVVFAMNSLGTTPSKVDWYNSPDTATHNMNVYTYDFNSDNLNKISSQPNGNAYYPSFSNDGEDVVWLSQELGNKNGSDNTKYSIKRMALKDSPSMKFVDLSQMRSCQLTDNSTMALLAIGKLWEDVCSDLNTNMNVSSLASLPLSLSNESCSNMVNKYWNTNKAKFADKESLNLKLDTGRLDGSAPLSAIDQVFYKNKILALKEADLLKTCEGLKDPSTQNNNVSLQATGNVEKGTNPIQDCIQCHNQGANYIPFDKPEKLGPWKKKMLLHVMTGNMPRNMPLSVEDRAELIEYLETIDDSGVEEKK